MARSLGRWLGLIILSLVTLVSFAPLIGVFLSIAVATGLGCALDEGSQHPCFVAGTDIGGMLTTGFVLGWLTFVTWPFVLLTVIIWAVLLVRLLLRRRRAP